MILRMCVTDFFGSEFGKEVQIKVTTAFVKVILLENVRHIHFYIIGHLQLVCHHGNYRNICSQTNTQILIFLQGLIDVLTTL